ncbi:uncharacterized protein Nmlp_3716 [Natronomonas moolapensis 8.8.11]|uniref:Uncharacterized protein n=1 Tax=Natronomonas moolapensis (strain DSM 18674 / CECT 7526 / JCM 14361 / 8.8.11) TaxID=268739 RepID=M1Y5I4_NATM8|nr:hypothetical protein [Natronomonas moolapensis]CCQ37830.1 uncharacterized protein Nmlp_3716 [Natronomonas moolapensis 8.8.11]
MTTRPDGRAGTGPGTPPPIARIRGLLARTGVAIRGAVGRRDGRATLVVVAVLYLLTYLWALRDLTASGPGGLDVFVVAEPVSTALTPLSPFLFEAVARIEAGPIVYLFRPVNVALGLGLGLLVGVTLSVSVVSWRGPDACRIGAGAGATAGVPGLLSGFACCGPQLLVVIGLQASAGLVAAMQWMVPLAVVSLLFTLFWVGSRVRIPE